MKRLTIILLIAIPFTLNAQRAYVDSIQISAITGTDTTLFVPFRTVDGGSIQFDFTNFDADDAILDFAQSNDKAGAITIDDTRIPVTLSKVTYTKSVNGVTKNRYGFEADQWNFKYIAIKLTKTSVTSGTLIWTWVR